MFESSVISYGSKTVNLIGLDIPSFESSVFCIVVKNYKKVFWLA